MADKKIQVIVADITTCRVDAVVNAANNLLLVCFNEDSRRVCQLALEKIISSNPATSTAR